MATAKCVKCGRECSGSLYNVISTDPWKTEYPVCFEHYELTQDDYEWLAGTGRYGQ